ncbi:MAG: phosphoribosylglycinamide formyltransferase [Candidatus Omnitrophota bacterium]|nr:MAG: phosphoribosylglycinamide formyltransferase [Candidatus Omnitrophota bacterium]
MSKKAKQLNMAIFASGNGSNFEAIVKAVKRGYVKANLKILIVDKEKAYARKRAERLKVPHVFVDPKKYKSRASFDKAIINILNKEKIDIIALAGYMRILSNFFVRKYKNRMLNVHPAILPALRGVDAIKRAFNYGCQVTGVTVHFVDEKVDHGPVILQETVKISPQMTLASLEKKIHALEHKLYPLAIKLLTEKKLKIKGRQVKII